MKRRSGWVVDTLESLYVGRGAPDLDFGARTLKAMAPGLDIGSGVGFSLVDFNDLKWRFFGMALPDGTLLDFSAQPPNLGFSEDQVAGLFKRLYNCPAPGTSTRTVANQVAALLRKTGAHIRRAFLGVSRVRN